MRRSGGKDGRRDSRDDDGDFVLVARFVPTGGAFLEGRVLDADTGRPVAGTSIEARRAGQYMKGTTDGTGAFRMAGMLPGSRVVVWVGGKPDAFGSPMCSARSAKALRSASIINCTLFAV